MRLLVLTDRDQSRTAGGNLAATVAAAVAGGATAIVYREKTLPEVQRRALGERVAEACGSAELIVASDPVLARQLGATTVHLAADDPWPDGDDLLVGRSCHGAVELAGAAAHGAAYATLSPIFATDSKPGYGPALGVDELAALVADTPIPVLALGGIRADTVGACLTAGAAGVAVMGAVMGAEDPTAAVRALLDQEEPGMTPPVALTIAGSDSGGGAGIQADLKAFAALGVFGTSAITAVTSQNTVAVTRVDVLDPSAVDAQIDAVLSDLPVAAVKTGMLATAEIIQLVARRAAAGDLPHLVVDPVMVASSGDRLLAEDAEAAYRELLFPHAEVITPNLLEASVIVGRLLQDATDAAEAARELSAECDAWVVVKGGHLDGAASDAVAHSSGDTVLVSERIDTPNVHGTGCSFASATAAGLAQGLDPLAALHQAKRLIDRGVRGGAAWRLGAGHGPIDHFGWESPP